MLKILIITMLLLWSGLNAQENSVGGNVYFEYKNGTLNLTPDSLKFAETEDLGVPFIPRGVGQIDSGTLSSDGNSVYTLKDGLITHFQLRPFKKLESFRTQVKWKKEISMFVTNDQRRLIVHDRYKVVLFNLESKRLVSMQDIAKNDRGKRFVGILKDDIFITLASQPSDKSKNFALSTHTYHDMIFWNSENLEKINKFDFKNFESPLEMGEKSVPICNLFVIEDKLLILTGPIHDYIPWTTLTIFDTDTLAIQKRFNEGTKFLLGNSNFLQIENENNRNFYDIKNNRILNDEQMLEKEFVRSPILFSCKIDYSQENDYILYKRRPYKYFRIQEKIKPFDFHQFEDGKAVMIRKGYFISTGDVQQYLKMKMLNKEVLPINDSTYKKYLNRGLINE